MTRTPYRIIITFDEPKRISLQDYEKLSEADNSSIEQLSPRRFVSYLSQDEYFKQMMNPDEKWKCPVTGLIGEWDDYHYEKYMNH